MINSDILQTDEEVVGLIQKGDKDRFGLLISRYESKLSRYGRKFLSEKSDITDIVQDVFINAYRNLQSFDPRQKFSAWIYRIAHNAFINELKKKKYRPIGFFDFDTLFAHVAYADPSVSEREQAELHQMIDRGLAKLSVKYQEVLILHYLEELDYQTISEVLKIPVGTVGVRLKRARVELKKVYDALAQNYEQ